VRPFADLRLETFFLTNRLKFDTAKICGNVDRLQRRIEDEVALLTTANYTNVHT